MISIVQIAYIYTTQNAAARLLSTMSEENGGSVNTRPIITPMGPFFSSFVKLLVVSVSYNSSV